MYCDIYFDVQIICRQYFYVFVNLFFLDIVDIYNILGCNYVKVWVVDIFVVQFFIEVLEKNFMFFGFNGQESCVREGQDSDKGYKDNDVVCD